MDLLPSVDQRSIPAVRWSCPCDHCVVMAGFWNAHVHFTEPKVEPGGVEVATTTLNAQLADMFLSHGFTTVIDVGSNPADTLCHSPAIERRAARSVISTTPGPPLYPPHGIPFYIKDSDAALDSQWLLPQPETPDAARRTCAPRSRAPART